MFSECGAVRRHIMPPGNHFMRKSNQDSETRVRPGGTKVTRTPSGNKTKTDYLQTDAMKTKKCASWCSSGVFWQSRDEKQEEPPAASPHALSTRSSSAGVILLVSGRRALILPGAGWLFNIGQLSSFLYRAENETEQKLSQRTND